MEIPLDTLLEAENMSVEQPFVLRESGYESSIVCELKLRVGSYFINNVFAVFRPIVFTCLVVFRLFLRWQPLLP